MTIRFRSEKLYLSHGDDPYGSDMISDAPSSLIPISDATYNTWFPANDKVTAAKNTGRQSLEINLLYPSVWVLDNYCDDIAHGMDHANGKVFTKYFGRIFTVPELEAAGLWQKLDQKIATYPCSM